MASQAALEAVFRGKARHSEQGLIFLAARTGFEPVHRP
jgi:hypothetical protein